ncbi:DMT family transporter [Marinomonas colpomeniae]|uniref:EamA family transporter n=1 Tax=Marinomonas colpomeniae TaxID=2774408 RepID=A0ABR8P0P0_9GAMM|nr:DMT family transporter [Marinomonas colpomeniae]MBD5770852.1 EamA family transporter [Marinomonas colpomeniae]
MNRSATNIGTIELVIAMMLSGTIGYFVISSEQSLWNVVFFRCVIGAVVLGGYAYFSGLIRREFFKRSVLLMIILGGITLVANWIFLFASFNYIPFSIATVAYHMQPLFLVLVGAIITREKPSGSLLVWLALAFVGLFLIVELDVNEIAAIFSGDSSASSEPSALIGLLLALGAAMLYTVTTLVTKKVSQVPSTFVALVQVIAGIFILLPFVDLTNLPTQTNQWIDLLVLGAVMTGFMYIIMYDSFQKLPTSLIALLSFIYPVTALFVDYAAFSTQISLWQGLGVLLILLAVCAVKFNWQLPLKPSNTKE